MNNGDVGGPRGRGRGWNQPETQPKELRRPRAQPGLELDRGDAPRSTLSAEAKEWYPPNYTVPTTQMYVQPEPAVHQGRFSVQNRLRMYQEPENDPYDFDNLSASLEDVGESDDLQESIGRLISVMCEVTFCPGKFDILCGPLIDTFASTLHDAAYTRPLVDAIVNQSIYEANFRYNGARLCSMYDSIAPPEESTFRSCLLERCAAEENKIIGRMEPDEVAIRGFAVFLAEIYTQLEDTRGGRIKTLGGSLCKILLFLLDTNEEKNIKAVCQLLKLSGIALDADCATGMHAAFSRLNTLQQHDCVRKVIALRQARWGLAEPRHARDNGEVVSSPDSGEGGDSIYLADGATLTAEERAFLQSNQPSNNDDDILEEIENDAWVTGMDPEMQAGFLEFLKMSNQIKR